MLFCRVAGWRADEAGLVGDDDELGAVARRVDAGMVFINNYFRGIIGTPFGGTKHSGYGREHAIETLREFSYTKMVRVPSGLGTVPSWRAIGDIFDNAA